MGLILRSGGAPGFNEFFYLLNNPGVADAVENGSFSSGLEHYLRHGKSEGRSSHANEVALN